MGYVSIETVGRILAGGLLLLTLDVSAGAPPDADSMGRPVGQSLYRDGLRASGEPVRAIVQKNVALNGADAACVKCHRRSGLGGSEGQNPIRPIAGRLLFSQGKPESAGRRAIAASSAALRPPYSRASLARALREGIDPAGRPLDALMPRYDLSDEEIAQLHAYLEGLSSTADPGVSDREIHFSTIITPDISSDRRSAMLDVLQGFFRDKNGGTRKETRRREVGSEQMYRAFRTWVLHVWALKGAPETWGTQLEEYYRQQSVFAVIGGIGGGTWQPVHTFCETFEVPCIFPDVDYPDVAGTDYYPLYFSRGVTLEAEVLAKHLLETSQSAGNDTVVQVYRDNALGRVPAQVLRAALLRSRGETVVDYPLAEGDQLSMETLAKLAGKDRPYVLVVWLGSADSKDLGFSSEPAALKGIYMSASLSAIRRPDFPAGWLSKLSMVYPFDLPANREQRLMRMKVWLHARKIPLTDERTQANAFFAAIVTGDAISHLGDNFSRDYLIERIEQMTQSSLSPSIYPHLSLGPGQRFASKGGYVIRFPTGADGTPLAISEWLIP